MLRELKIWPQYFWDVAKRKKNFELRRNDRGFKVDDILLLREWCPKLQDYTGRQIQRKVTYILEGPAFGIEAGFCVMSLEVFHKEKYIQKIYYKAKIA